jgi:phage-related protein
VNAATITSTTAGVIALVIGLFLSWKQDAPRVRLALLIAGTTSVTAGLFGQATGKAADTVTSASTAATTSLFGSAVGIVGLVILALLIARGVLKGALGRLTDVAAIVVPPLASSFGGIVWAACLLISALIAWVITGTWELAAQAAASFKGVGA